MMPVPSDSFILLGCMVLPQVAWMLGAIAVRAGDRQPVGRALRRRAAGVVALTAALEIAFLALLVVLAVVLGALDVPLRMGEVAALFASISTLLGLCVRLGGVGAWLFGLWQVVRADRDGLDGTGLAG